MIISNKTFFSLSTQTDIFGYDMDISLSNTTGSAYIGFSGTGISDDIFHFLFQSGKIYDYEGRFIYGYAPNEQVNIWGNTSGDKNIYYINDVPVSLDSIRSSNYIEYFYVDPLNVIINTDLNLSGNSPDYYISDVTFRNQSLTGTGYFVNTGSDKQFRVNTGVSNSIDVSFISSQSGNITPSNSGYFTIRKNYEDITAEELSDNSYPSPFTFYTNFGQLITNVNISTIYDISQDLTTDIPNQIIGSGITYGFLNWYNYKGGAKYSSSGLDLTYHILENSGVADVTGNWLVEIGSLNVGGSYSSIGYNSVISGYSGVVPTYGFSGLSFKITRLNTNSGNLNFYFDGYDDNLESILSGVT